MITGPIPLRVVAAFLGKREAEIHAVLEADRIPFVPMSSGKRPEVRIYLTALLDWVNGRAAHGTMTAEQLSAELERCRDHLLSLDAKKRAEKSTKATA